jgi:hypothetical protein
MQINTEINTNTDTTINRNKHKHKRILCESCRNPFSKGIFICNRCGKAICLRCVWVTVKKGITNWFCSASCGYKHHSTVVDTMDDVYDRNERDHENINIQQKERIA